MPKQVERQQESSALRPSPFYQGCDRSVPPNDPYPPYLSGGLYFNLCLLLSYYESAVYELLPLTDR